jgi:S1-C subfamily serine protease
MHKVFFKLVLSSVVSILIGCATQVPVVQHQQLPEINNRYDSEFPVKSISSELDFVSETIKKLDCIAFYRSYAFAENNTLDLNGITEEEIEHQAVASEVTNESVTGTATIIYYDGVNVGLLTCAHVVDFPDTIIVRYNNGLGPIQFLSVKIKQQNYINSLPDGDDVEFVAADSKSDLAFLKKNLGEHVDKIEVLNYPVGNSKELEWGTIVYVMGFPMGNKMVTRAIVSNPDKSNRNRFLTDALYNRGISGSPVLAIRDGVPNLELVGIASSAAVQTVYYLKPGKEDPEFINTEEIYSGNVYPDHKKIINYGVTFNVPIESVVEFLNKNRKLIESKGFDSKLFFK